MSRPGMRPRQKRARRIERRQLTTQGTTERRGLAGPVLGLAALVALAALAVLTVTSSGQAAGAKGKHRHKVRSHAGVIASDTGAEPNGDFFWGGSYCENASQLQNITSGGDTHLTATGASQGDSAFRRMTVFDGDDVWGERCELGWDNKQSPTVFYRQGTHRITEISFRLPSNFPVNVSTWQAVMQMKQAGPANNAGGAPALSLNVYGGRWRFRQAVNRTTSTDLRQLWSAPARLNFWTRFVFDIRYSDRNKKGFIRVGADLNGDGDIADPGELSPAFHTHTLKMETPGGSADGIEAGQPLASDLSAGIYHDSSVPCPAPNGCSVDVDNVQVLRP
jgi:Polysaccharide lyase